MFSDCTTIFSDLIQDSGNSNVFHVHNSRFLISTSILAAAPSKGLKGHEIEREVLAIENPLMSRLYYGHIMGVVLY